MFFVFVCFPVQSPLRSGALPRLAPAVLLLPSLLLKRRMNLGAVAVRGLKGAAAAGHGGPGTWRAHLIPSGIGSPRIRRASPSQSFSSSAGAVS